MKMTFNDYIQNPAGKRNAVFSQREMYRAFYAGKMDKLLLREHNKIDYFLYYTGNDEYYIHMKIPSEVIENFYYDTVVKFYNDNPALTVAPTLEKYNVKFFSNDPSFVYTYAHTFIDKELFIEELKDRMSKIAIKKSADVRNPDNVVGYVKSLYFCYLIMKNKGLFTKIKYNTYGKKYNKKQLLSSIEPADIKIQKRKEEEEKKNSKKIKKNTEEKPRENEHFITKDLKKINPSKPVKTVNKTKTIRKTGYVKKK